MRSREVEEAIYRLKFHKESAQTKDECFITNIINADILLSYIEELEKLPNKIRDKIKELEEKLKYIGGCDNDCKKCFNSERENSFEYCFA